MRSIHLWHGIGFMSEQPYFLGTFLWQSVLSGSISAIARAIGMFGCVSVRFAGVCCCWAFFELRLYFHYLLILYLRVAQIWACVYRLSLLFFNPCVCRFMS